VANQNIDLSFITAPFAMRPGLSRLADGEKHLATGDSRAVQEKFAALTHPASDALLLAPGFDPLPGLHALARTAAAEYPAAFTHQNHALYAISTELMYEFSSNIVMDTALNDPLAVKLPNTMRHGWQGLAALLALSLEEDFAIVNGPARTLDMLAVALPSHWIPAEKVGQTFHSAHTPVADNKLLLAAGDSLMALVTGGERWQRHVWVVTPSARRDAHPARHTRKPWPAHDRLLTDCYLRVERQTFIPVPDMPQAVFTIHVSTHPLVDVCSHRANVARLRDALATQSDAVLAYRSMPPAVRDALVTQLSQIA
jgi:dimethylamine monooxygenase subunit A